MAHSVHLPVSYRQAEVAQIFRRVKAGDSCAIIGAGGMAKSNLFQHVLRIDVRDRFLGADSKHYIFSPVAVHALPIIDEPHVYELIVRNLLEGAAKQGALKGDCISQVHVHHSEIEKSFHIGEHTAIQRAFLSAIEILAIDLDLRLVILFEFVS